MLVTSLKHYGAVGMKWKDHKYVMPEDKPGTPTVIRKQPLTMMPSYASGVERVKRMVSKSAVSTNKPRKKKRMKDLNKKQISNGQSIVSSMKMLMNKPLNKFVSDKPSIPLPRLISRVEQEN